MRRITEAAVQAVGLLGLACLLYGIDRLSRSAALIVCGLALLTFAVLKSAQLAVQKERSR